MAEALLDPDGVYDFVRGRLIGEDLNNFAPSIGLAWDPFGDAKTVFRAGYGIAYVNDEAIRSVDGWLNRFGVSESASLSNLTTTIAQGLPAIPAPEFELPLAIGHHSRTQCQRVKALSGFPTIWSFLTCRPGTPASGESCSGIWRSRRAMWGPKGPNCSVEST